MTLWSGQLYDVWRYGRNQRMTQCITQTFCPSGVDIYEWGGYMWRASVLGFGQKTSICADPKQILIFFGVFAARHSQAFARNNPSTSTRVENYEIMGCMTQCLVIHFASYVIQGVWRNDLASCMTYDAMTGQAYDVWRYDWLRRMTVIRVWCMTSDALVKLFSLLRVA